MNTLTLWTAHEIAGCDGPKFNFEFLYIHHEW